MKWPRDESGRHQICRSCVPIICRGRDLLPVFTWSELCVQHKRCSSNGLFSRGMHCVFFFFPSVWICNDLNRPEGDTMQPVIMWHNGTVWKTAAHVSLVSGNDICSVIMEVFARVWPPKKLLYCEFKAFFCFPRDQMQKCSPSRRPRALCCATVLPAACHIYLWLDANSTPRQWDVFMSWKKRRSNLTRRLFFFISVKPAISLIHKRANLILKRSRLFTSNQTRFLSGARIKII